MLLLTSKLNIELKKKWSGVMFGALLYMVQRPGHQENWNGIIWTASKCGAGGEWRR